MKKLSKIICIIIALTVTLTCFSSCSGSGEIKKPTDEIDDSTMIRLPVSKTDTYNPFYAETEFNNEVTTLIYDPLVKIGADLTPENFIASDVKVEGKTVRVTIRSDVYFSDGTLLRDSDVIYSFKEAKESANYEKKLANFSSVSSSGGVLTFVLIKEDIYAANCLDFPIVKAPAKSSKADDEYDTDEEIGIPTGSGRYKFEDATYNTLVFNDRWIGKELPKVRRIKLVNLIDISAAVASMETGNISFLFQDLSAGQFNRVNAKTKEVLMTNLVYLGINSGSDALSKQTVRQALSLAINKKSIAENSFLGYATEAPTPFYPLWKELKNVRLEEINENEDLFEAQNLLDKAGYGDRDNLGIRSSGEIQLSLLVNSDNAYKSAAADEIASSFKKLGIKVTVNKQPFDMYVEELQAADYDLYIGEIKLTNNMSLSGFFNEEGGASYGIDTSSLMVKKYTDFRAGKITLQQFTDYFAAYVPFIPICYRYGIAAYTNELSYTDEGTQSDIYSGIYTWKY